MVDQDYAGWDVAEHSRDLLAERWRALDISRRTDVELDDQPEVDGLLPQGAHPRLVKRFEVLTLPTVRVKARRDDPRLALDQCCELGRRLGVPGVEERRAEPVGATLENVLDHGVIVAVRLGVDDDAAVDTARAEVESVRVHHVIGVLVRWQHFPPPPSREPGVGQVRRVGSVRVDREPLDVGVEEVCRQQRGFSSYSAQQHSAEQLA